MSSNKLMVEAIEKGTVIDHIHAGAGIKILRWLQLLNDHDRITVGLNLPSKHHGYKDLIKVENRILTDQEASELAIFAPEATVNRIEDYKVKDKFAVSLPKKVTGVFLCPNSNCITRTEKVATLFKLENNKKGLRMKCHYCEKHFNREVMTKVAF